MFLSYIPFIYFACTRVNMCHCVHVEVRGQLICGVALFLSGSWGIECWWSGFMASTLTSWVISPALLFLIACVPVWCACVSAATHVLWCGCRGQRMTTLNFSRQDFSFFLRHDILQINWFKSFWEIFLFLPSISPGISGVCCCIWLFMWVSGISLRFTDL